MPASKAELRAWCRQRYGNEWHAEDKAARLEQAEVALSAAAEAAAAPPTAAGTAPPAAPPASAVSTSDLRAWCRQRYGSDWHAADKAARLAEARVALSGADARPGAPAAGAKRKDGPTAAAPPPAKHGDGGPGAKAGAKGAASGGGGGGGASAGAAAPAAAGPKEPKQTLDEALQAPGSAKAYVSLMQIQRSWNMLDHSGEMTFQVIGESIQPVPVYYDKHERREMLGLMKEVKREKRERERESLTRAPVPAARAPAPSLHSLR